MVIPEIKRRLEEIIARYTLHPSLKDVYVEGVSDRKILEWFLEKKYRTDVRVYTIETVEIPNRLLKELKLDEHSNRDKVIALAEEMTRIFAGKNIRVKCIVDADYDRYLSSCRNNYFLEYTDYTCMEMYFFNEECVKKFLNLVLNGFPLSSSILIKYMKSALQRIFLIRLANEKLDWKMKWLDFKRYIKWTGKKFEFDEESFIKSYLMKNSRIRDIEAFKSAMGDFNTQLDPDPRHNIRGHDFTYLFFLCVKKLKQHKSGFNDPDTFERTLCGCLELGFVEKEKLFVKLNKL